MPIFCFYFLSIEFSVSFPIKQKTAGRNIFVRQSLRDGGIPFEIKMDQPNKETMAAMLEAERIAKDPNVKHYSDVEEALRELKR